MICYKCYVMLEPRTHLLHNVRTVFPCGLLSSVCFWCFHFAHCFVLLDSVNAAVKGIDCEWTGPTLRLTMQHICRRGGPKMRLRYCLIPSLEPNHPRRFLHLRAIQRHTKATLVDSWHDNVLIPDDLAEYMYHIGNVTDMHSITNSGLIPRLRKERDNACSSQP